MVFSLHYKKNTTQFTISLRRFEIWCPDQDQKEVRKCNSAQRSDLREDSRRWDCNSVKVRRGERLRATNSDTNKKGRMFDCQAWDRRPFQELQTYICQTDPHWKFNMENTLSSQQSAVRSQHSAVSTQGQHSAVSTQQSALSSQHSALSTKQSALSSSILQLPLSCQRSADRTKISGNLATNYKAPIYHWT